MIAPKRIEITIENPNEIPSIFKKNKSISTRLEFKLVKIEKTEISKIIEDCRLFNIESSNQYSSLLTFLEEGNQELNVEIRCEGHTDDAILPPQSDYRNNWELSSARSLRVVNIMNNASTISEKYFSYNGYGEFRPLINVSGIDDFQKKKQARAYNRRVEIYLDAFARPKTRSSEDEFLKMLNNKFNKEEES